MIAANNDEFNNACVEVLSEMYPHTDKDLLLKQVELEEIMRAEGMMRQERIIEQAQEKGIESNTSYGTLLLRDRVHKIAAKVDELLEAVRAGKPGYARSNLKLIQHLDSKIIAYISLKTLIDSIAKKTTLQYVAVGIASILEDEVRYQTFRENAKEDFKWAITRASGNTTYRRRRDAMNTMMQHKAGGTYDGKIHEELEWEAWEKDDKLGIGVRLVNIVIGCTGIAETKLFAGEKGKNSQYHILPTQAFKDWAKDVSTRTGLLSPITLPCVIPPRDYEGPLGGGYHTTYLGPTGILKTSNKAYRKQLAECIEDMAPVYEAVNAAQHTAWRINRAVLETVNALWRNGRTLGILPAQEDEPLPRCPKCGCIPEETANNQNPHRCFQDPETMKAWKKSAVMVHERNARAFSKRLQVHRILWAAEKMQPYHSIYFPYQLDFRGRLYAIPQFLNPQGNDLAKGLLEFAEAKPVNSERAARWLAIHVANTWGEDKASFDERVQWVRDNESRIVNIASDPLEYTEWTQADSPFCFLASCIEWAGFVREGYGYMSRIPVAQDGTCSGLQHYSAILRDEIGGKAVNLVPTDRPQDIYAVVAMRTINALNNIAPDDEHYHLAQQWLNTGIINRKTTKRSVMTLPYGSTLYSAKKYVREYVEDIREKDPNAIPWEIEETVKACNFLSGVVWDSIRETVVAAASAMDWLKEIAGIVADAGLPVTWKTPTGIPVLQTYVNAEYRRVETIISGSLYISAGGKQKDIERRDARGRIRLQMTLKEDGDEIDRHRQVTGLAPNFIHSMDASALVFAVLAAKEHGVNSFALIHDSFGTHAGGAGDGDSEQLAGDLRAAFVRMYTDHSVLEELRDHIQYILPPELKAKMPSLPSYGGLNINQILESRYFFA